MSNMKHIIFLAICLSWGMKRMPFIAYCSCLKYIFLIIDGKNISNSRTARTFKNISTLSMTPAAITWWQFSSLGPMWVWLSRKYLTAANREGKFKWVPCTGRPRTEQRRTRRPTSPWPAQSLARPGRQPRVTATTSTSELQHVSSVLFQHLFCFRTPAISSKYPWTGCGCAQRQWQQQHSQLCTHLSNLPYPYPYPYHSSLCHFIFTSARRAM